MSRPLNTRLVVRPGALGDSLLLAPALFSLRKQGATRIGLVGYTERLRILQAAGLADDLFSLDAWMHRTEKVLAWLGEEGSGGCRIDTFFQEHPPGLPPFPRFNPRSHSAFPEPPSGLHIADYFAACLEVKNPPEAVAPLEPLRAANPHRPPVLWIHPGAGGSAKRWPMESFLAVASRVQEGGGIETRWLLGEAELERLPTLRDSSIEARISPDLIEWAQETTGGDYYLGNDSGPTHLAALLGLRTLAVFGPEGDPTRWRPWGNKARVAGAEAGGAWPRLEEVIRALGSLSLSV